MGVLKQKTPLPGSGNGGVTVTLGRWDYTGASTEPDPDLEGRRYHRHHVVGVAKPW
jgi:hypothetical protein